MIKKIPGSIPYLLAFFSAFLFSAGVFAQNGLSDQELLRKKISGGFEPKIVAQDNYSTKGIGNFLLTFYQKNISLQISADCIFSPSCSRYSRLCIAKYGLVRGVLASGDRLMRCNGFCSRDIPEYKFGPDDLVHELPE